MSNASKWTLDMPIHILRIRDVSARTGLSRSSIYEYEKRGEFPRRVRLTERTVGWIASEIDTWLEGRANAS